MLLHGIECQALGEYLLYFEGNGVPVVTRQPVTVLSVIFCVVCSFVRYTFKRVEDQANLKWRS